MNKTTKHIVIDKKIHTNLKAIAIYEDKTLQELVNDILSEWLKQDE